MARGGGVAGAGTHEMSNRQIRKLIEELLGPDIPFEEDV